MRWSKKEALAAQAERERLWALRDAGKLLPSQVIEQPDEPAPSGEPAPGGETGEPQPSEPEPAPAPTEPTGETGETSEPAPAVPPIQ
jgi:hypothetical protein